MNNHVVVKEKGISWKTYEKKLIYTTEKDDNLASLASKYRIGLGELAQVNSTLLLDVKDTTRSVIDSTEILVANREISLEVAAAIHKTPVNDVALGFSNVPLKSGQEVNIPTSQGIYPKQGIDLILWSLIGVAIYLLSEATRNFRKITTGEADFLKETPWYWTQFLSGPLITVIVILLLIKVNVKILGDDADAVVSADLSKISADYLFIMAFVLGFYNRVARKILEQIVMKLFKTAWLAAHGSFKIVLGDKKPEDNVVESDSTVIFETQPATSVTWFATEGGIEASGVYKAPKVEENPKDIVISAVAGSGTGKTTSRVFKIMPVGKAVPVSSPSDKLEKIDAQVDDDSIDEGSDVAPEKEISFTVISKLSEEEAKQIQWSRTPEDDNVFRWEGDTRGSSATGQIPTGATPGTEITISAKHEPSNSEVTFKFKVAASNGEDGQ